MAPIAPNHQIVLTGRVVTMDAQDTVLDRGAVCVQDGVVQRRRGRCGARARRSSPACARWRAGGTIYPGLIELHNHLSYDILPLWQVPQQFTNRDQWRADTCPTTAS